MEAKSGTKFSNYFGAHPLGEGIYFPGRFPGVSSARRAQAQFDRRPRDFHGIDIQLSLEVCAEDDPFVVGGDVAVGFNPAIARDVIVPAHVEQALAGD